MLRKNVNASDLIKFLQQYGYREVRQTGSHIRLVSEYKKHKHKITIPNHKPIKIGTLNSIVNNVAEYVGKEKHAIINELNESL